MRRDDNGDPGNEDEVTTPYNLVPRAFIKNIKQTAATNNDKAHFTFVLTFRVLQPSLLKIYVVAYETSSQK